VSAHEIFTQRDQTTGTQLSLDDLKLIEDQFRCRSVNHGYSEQIKSGGKPPHPAAKVSIGDIVYLYNDFSKLSARPRYVVLAIDQGWCKLRRFADKQLGNISYKVKLTECYIVLEEVVESALVDDSVEEEDEVVTVTREKKAQPELEDKASDEEDLQEEVDLTEDDYPCSVCHKECTEDEDSLSCDTCEKWCHRVCADVSKEVYQQLVETDGYEFDYNCPLCNVQPAADHVEKVPPDRV
jgi:hypothetical protein